MNVYIIQYEGESRVVEAESVMKAIEVWREGMRADWGDGYTGKEDPDSCVLICDEAVITAGAGNSLAATNSLVRASVKASGGYLLDQDDDGDCIKCPGGYMLAGGTPAIVKELNGLLEVARNR